MPPKKFGKTLSPAQIETLRQWVAEGAEYRGHWAYIPPILVPPPQTRKAEWVRNPIDAFILARLEKQGLSPSSEADRTTLIRRLSLGLTGLPPTPAEVDAFVADPAPDAYERLVDRLLASPHYGERMASPWLDLARYADTNGGTLDTGREMWRYRDWVIAAFNENKPFNQFTVEQLAGDLLPDATIPMKVATGFLRNEPLHLETCPDQRDVLKLVDRVNTVASAWMGSTFACAQCHDHKYDPISQREYYQLVAIFNNRFPRGQGREAVDLRGNAGPAVRFPTLSQAIKFRELQSRINKADGEIARLRASAEDPPLSVVWVDDSLPSGATPAKDSPPWEFVPGPVAPFQGRSSLRVTAGEPAWRSFAGATDALAISRGDKVFAHVFLDPQNPPKEILIQFADSSPEHRAYWGEDRIPWGQNGHESRWRVASLPEAGKWVRLEVPAEAIGLRPGVRVTGLAVATFGGTAYWDGIGVARAPWANSIAQWEAFERQQNYANLPAEIQTALRADPKKRTAQQVADIQTHFIRYVNDRSREQLTARLAERDLLGKEIDALQAQIVTTMVMADPEKKDDTFVLIRGDFSQRGEKVDPGLPKFLPPLPAGEKVNRLSFARWLTAPSHPLTARVMVNRIWQMHFGTGLVATSEDFGSQGEPPSHPELLDWLAVRFVESGWDVKRMHKLIVGSSTYRQSNRVTPRALQVDPDNRLYARGPRFRLPAETIRDNTLAIGGLLDRRLGGPGVRPYQPAGLWEAIRHPGKELSAQDYVQSHGSDLYRRGVYLFWKRTMPHPTMSLFDAPNRDVCVVRRPRTNTALQALALLNDPAVVESARGVAVRMCREAGPGLEARLVHGFRLCTARHPRPDELAVLCRVHAAELARFRGDRGAATALLGVGESPTPSEFDPVELAALTVVANLLLNLDETITLE